jgi:Pyruvate/2-oxoacid:ferredoxin oxidoreductase gamma subunit
MENQMTEKELKKLSSDELYALAKQKEEDERKWFEEENKAKIAELRQQRKEMLQRHKKEISEINKQIKSLGGRVPVSSAAVQGATSATAAIVEILEAGELDTKTIREKLDELGVGVKSLGQTLAYLKKNGQIASVARGIYKKAE